MKRLKLPIRKFDMDPQEYTLIRHTRKYARQTLPLKKQHAKPLKPLNELASTTALASMSRKFLKVALF